MRVSHPKNRSGAGRSAWISLVSALHAAKRLAKGASTERDEALTRLYAERQRTREAIGRLHELRKRARARERAWLHLNLTDEEQTEAGLVSPRDRLVVRLAAINGKMPQSRPRYFSLVQLPEQQALSFAASYPAFSRDWLGADGSLILLLARTGKILDEYRTVIACLAPATSVHAASPTPAPAASGRGREETEEYRLVQMMEGKRKRRLSAMKVIDSHVVSHNLAAVLVPPSATSSAASTSRGASPPTLFAMGGQFMEHRSNRLASLAASKGWSATHHAGIYAMNATSLRDVVERSWFPFGKGDNITREPLIDGRHDGCIEKRRSFNNVCYFDGKLSLAWFRGRFFLYARANLKAAGGGRFLQVATSRSASLASGSGHGFGPFALLTIQGYDSQGPGNIYMAGIQRHPFGDPSLLLGLFAVNLGNRSEARVERWREGRGYGNTDGKSFIGLALSVGWGSACGASP
jgi:hypothetical protein